MQRHQRTHPGGFKKLTINSRSLSITGRPRVAPYISRLHLRRPPSFVAPAEVFNFIFIYLHVIISKILVGDDSVGSVLFCKIPSLHDFETLCF